MEFMLYISYKDICWNEKIRISDSDPMRLYDEMKLTHVYETHWTNNHTDLGYFPYSEDSPLFPSFEHFQQILNSLNIGQIKYVMRSKRNNCSYFCGCKRLS
jgi:hypothetical protein